MNILTLFVLMLGLIVVLLAAILGVQLWDRDSARGAGKYASAAVTQAIDAAVERLDTAIRHHVDVVAVLEAARQFTGEPDLPQHLSAYSDQVVAAALMYRVNTLAAQYQTAIGQLSMAREEHGRVGGSDLARRVSQRQALVDEILGQLQQARADAVAFAAACGAFE
jgi:hypothetical protein